MTQATAQRRKRRPRKITQAKKHRAIDALVALMECDDFPKVGTCWEIENACDFVRKLKATQ